MMLEDQLDQIGAPRSPADKITSNPFLSIPTSPSQLKSSQQLMKEKIDTLESTILAKAEIKCGFAAEYEFAMMLYKVPPYNVLSPNSQNTLLTIRQALCGSNEYLGLRYYRAVMRLPSLDGEGLVLKADMMEQILPRTGRKVRQVDFAALLDEIGSLSETRSNANNSSENNFGNDLYCDRNSGPENDMVNAKSFLNHLKRNMELSRKRLVRAVFDRMDSEGRGYISARQLKACYRTPLSAHHLPSLSTSPRKLHSPSSPTELSSSSVVSTIATTPSPAPINDALTVLDYMEAHDVQRRAPAGCVTWAAFLDYYRWISLAIEGNRAFESFLMSSWLLPAEVSSSSTFAPPATAPPAVARVNTAARRGSGGLGSPSKSSFDKRSPNSVEEMSSMNISSPKAFLFSRARATTPVNLRVTVTKSNGEEDEVMLRDDLGTMRYSLPSIEKAVQKQGLQDIAKVTW
eukprot:scaffold1110_cov182-Ochromonas_danica.AAC.10